MEPFLSSVCFPFPPCCIYRKQLTHLFSLWFPRLRKPNSGHHSGSHPSLIELLDILASRPSFLHYMCICNIWDRINLVPGSSVPGSLTSFPLRNLFSPLWVSPFSCLALSAQWAMASWLKHDKVLFLLSNFAYVIHRCFSTLFLSLFFLFVYVVPFFHSWGTSCSFLLSFEASPLFTIIKMLF